MAKPPTKPAGNKPAHEVRLGTIKASIWLNDTTQGPRYNTTFERSYRDGEEWKTSDSFGRDDLLTVGFVAAEALRWIMEQKQVAGPSAS
jgi:hypothetical protein